MMLRQNKAGTISALFIGLLVLVVLMASVDRRVSAIARQQTAATITPTPCDEEDQEDCDDYGTDTAIAYYDTQTAIADTTAEAGTSTVTSTATTDTNRAGTPAVTPTTFASPTSFTTGTTPAPAQPTPIAQTLPLVPTETPTAIPNDTLTCYPGQPLVITGDGPPRTPFLVYFGQRVVSGGSVTSSGRFATTLMIGREHAGVYEIVVRVRGTSQVLLETSCAVPDVTPTFVPRARTLP
jgi:hypothetical protein